MNVVQGRHLGIDFGTKRVGLAISDPSMTIATSLKTLLYHSSHELMAKLHDVCERHGVAQFVVGLPLTMKGEKGIAAQKVEAFVELLEGEFTMPIVYVDERLTSKIAEQTLQSCGKSPSRNKGEIDKIAAMIILQTHLDRIHASV